MKPKVLPGLAGGMLGLCWYFRWFSSCHLYVCGGGRSWYSPVSHPAALLRATVTKGGTSHHQQGAGRGMATKCWFGRSTLLLQPAPGTGTALGLSCTHILH